MISNQMPSEASAAASCRESRMRCSSLIRFHSGSAVEGDQLGRPEPLAVLEGCVPVQFLVRVEGVLGGRFEQPFGDLLPVLEHAKCVAEYLGFRHCRHPLMRPLVSKSVNPLGATYAWSRAKPYVRLTPSPECSSVLACPRLHRPSRPTTPSARPRLRGPTASSRLCRRTRTRGSRGPTTSRRLRRRTRARISRARTASSRRPRCPTGSSSPTARPPPGAPRWRRRPRRAGSG